jgi:hypothetical protein
MDGDGEGMAVPEGIDEKVVEAGAYTRLLFSSTLAPSV